MAVNLCFAVIKSLISAKVRQHSDSVDIFREGWPETRETENNSGMKVYTDTSLRNELENQSSTHNIMGNIFTTAPNFGSACTYI